MTFRRQLPNFLTGLNLACGTGALMCAVDGRPETIPLALALIVGALFFDMADGRVARKLGVTTDLGLELDSLADLVSFCVAPAMLLWRMRLADGGALAALVPVAFVVAGAFRLARFNVLSQQGQPATKWFVGMPTPAAASVALTAGLGHTLPGFGAALAAPVVALVTLVAAGLMVCRIPFPSPKVLPLSSRRFVAAAIALIGIAAVTVQGKLALASLAYVGLGLSMAVARAVTTSAARLTRAPRSI